MKMIDWGILDKNKLFKLSVKFFMKGFDKEIVYKS